MVVEDRAGLQDELAKEAPDLGDIHINEDSFEEINLKQPKRKSAAYETHRTFSAFSFMRLRLLNKSCLTEHLSHVTLTFCS
jgi:hypothetical protein